MTNSNVPMYEQVVQGWPAQFTNSNGTTPVSILTAGSNAGSRITSLGITTNDTVTGNMQFSILRSGTAYLLTTINIPIGAGNTNTIPTVDAFGSAQWPSLPVDSNGNQYLDLKAGDVLQGTLLAAPSTAKTFNVYACGGDF